jgi:hypothetical protein
MVFLKKKENKTNHCEALNKEAKQLVQQPFLRWAEEKNQHLSLLDRFKQILFLLFMTACIHGFGVYFSQFPMEQEALAKTDEQPNSAVEQKMAISQLIRQN